MPRLVSRLTKLAVPAALAWLATLPITTSARALECRDFVRNPDGSFVLIHQAIGPGGQLSPGDRFRPGDPMPYALVSTWLTRNCRMRPVNPLQRQTVVP